MDNFRTDTPVNTQKEDSFQRYEYSKRIAAIINTAKFPQSLVIGIYGKWGEGKPSVLNFISTEIDDSAIKINFNPWYFQDEKQL